MGKEKETPTTEDPTASELAALRKEKDEREAADRAKDAAELVDLRAKVAAGEKPTVKAPKTKKEKAKEAPAEVTPPPKKRGIWWPEQG